MPTHDDARVFHASPRGHCYALPLILLLALVLRCGVVWFRSDQLYVDRDAYLGIAQNVARGAGFCSPGSTTPTAYRPPLYPLLLAIHLPRSANNGSITDRQFTVGLWNILAGLWTVLLVDHIGKALGLGRWRHLAALLVAADPLLLYATPQPMTEVLFTALATAWLWMVTSPIPIDPDKALMRCFWIGVLFGLAALCRPTIWPLAGLMAIAAFVQHWVAGAGAALGEAPVFARSPGLPSQSLSPAPATQRIKSIVVTVFGALLIVSPWVIRNHRVFGRPILMTTHGGYTLLLANNPVYYHDVVEQPWGTVWSGDSLARWQAEVERALHDELGPQPTELQRDAWMSAAAQRYIRDEPLKFLRAALHRVRCLWSVAPQGEGTSLPASVRFGVGAFFGVEYLLALIGFAILIRRREWPAWLPAFLLIAAIQGVHLVYWTDARMRAPLQPVLALLAVKAVGSAVRTVFRPPSE